MNSIKTVTDEAISFLRDNCSGTHFLVMTSGGKDSIVTTHLAKMSGISFELQSTMTGIDPPELIRFIKRHYPECQFVRPKLSFWHLLTTHNPPGGTGRGIKWCCTKIKEDPSNKTPNRSRILGIRAEESNIRVKYSRIDFRENNGQTLYYPIFYWNEWHIWEFIKAHNLPYPKLYNHGFDRLGCVICPNHQNHHDIYRNRWPNHFKCFERYVNIWWNKRKWQGRDMYHESPQEFLKDWYSGKFYYYKHEKKELKIDDRQLKLF